MMLRRPLPGMAALATGGLGHIHASRAAAAGAGVLRVAPYTDLKTLDPVAVFWNIAKS
jgi:hypothetical protein